MAHLEAGRLGEAADGHLEASKVRARHTIGGIIGQQILGAKLVADLAEGVVDFVRGSSVKVAAAGVLGKLNQRVLAAGVATRAGLNGDDDDAVDDRLGFLGRA